MAEFDLSIYEQRIQSFRASDHDRERLVSELLHKHTTLLEEYRILKSDFASERDTRRYYQKLIEDKQRAIADREKLLANQEQEIDNNSFVLALIDGDGVIFQDALLQAGSNGGSEAASRLQSVILDYLGSIYNNSGNWSIMVQIYVSLDKLAQKLASVGLLRAPYELRSFAQSFSLNQPLFSIIDVGQGKERADHKIKEMLRTFSDNPTCRHMFFGGCHDAGYLINLDQYKHNAIKASHITLLESTPAYRGFADLPNFKRTRFDEVFRSEHLPDGPPVPIPQSVQTPVQTPVPGPIRSLTNKSSPSASPKTTPATISPTTSSPITAPSAPSVSSVPSAPSAPSAPPAPSAPSAPSALSSASNQTDQTPTDPSWVNVGKAGSATGNINIASTSKKAKKVKKEYIYYNKDQQRLDEPLPRIDREAADSLERRRMAGGKKLCNNYHLNDGKCDQGKFCQFQHDPKLSAEEKVALKYKTRTLPCRNRYCENFKCYLGHQCSMERDYGECRYPDSCNLRSTHGMDKKKYSRWDQDGNEELAPGVVHVA